MSNNRLPKKLFKKKRSKWLQKNLEFLDLVMFSVQLDPIGNLGKNLPLSLKWKIHLEMSKVFDFLKHNEQIKVTHCEKKLEFWDD